MSTIQVANVNFESTANNQLVYAANTLTVRAGGANVIFANTTTLTTPGNLTVSNNITATGTVVMGSSFLRNRIINGTMYTSQRAGSGTVTAGTAVPTASAGYPCVDRFFVYSTGANVTAAQVGGLGSPATKYGLQVTGAASVTAVGIGQRIEQLNCRDMAGQTCTLSAFISNSLLTTVTWTASYATTSPNTFGTIGTPTKTQIATGTFTVSGTLTQYTASFSVPVAAVNGIEILFTVGAQTSGTWVVTEVQFETGAVATPFERLQYGTQLAQCQRYYQVNTNSLVSGYQVAANYYFTPFLLPVVMFVAPTVVYSTFSNSNSSNAELNGSQVHIIQTRALATATGFAYSSHTVTLSSEIA